MKNKRIEIQIIGSAGSGKTYFGNKIIEMLKENGIEKIRHDHYEKVDSIKFNNIINEEKGENNG